MEVIKNETVIEEQKTEDNGKMSEFCEALMGAVESLNEKATIEDGAILICSDGEKVSMRIHGSREVISNALLGIMKNKLDFAELIVETAMRYSHHMLGVRVARKMDNLN